jgi:hypothetical protein
MRENDGGVDIMKINYKHICKCHNASPLYNYYMLIKKEEKKAHNMKTWASFFPLSQGTGCSY